MTRAARITQAELKRMATIAVELGACVELAPNGTVRVFPVNPDDRQQDRGRIDKEEEIEL